MYFEEQGIHFAIRNKERKKGNEVTRGEKDYDKMWDLLIVLNDIMTG